VIHLSAEWVTYPLRASSSVFKLFRAIELTFPRIDGLLLLQSTDERDWLSFIALDFGLRCTVVITSALGVVFLLLIINRVPYIAHSSGLRCDALTERRTLLFTVASIGLEVANAALMNRLFFRRRDVDVLEKVLTCFDNKRFCLLATLLCSLSFIGVVFAFTH
jgi:hypothetical protein